MDVNNIDSTFDTIHEENLQAKESERQVLNSANRAKRTRVAPLTAGYGGGKKGAPTKEEREMRRRLAQQQIALKSDRADVAHAVEDAIVVEVSGTVHASPQDKDSEEPVIIGMPNVSEVGENINDVDL